MTDNDNNESSGSKRARIYTADTWHVDDGTWDDTASPRQASGLTGVAQTAAGGSFTLSLKSDGTAWGWGANLYGEIGNPAANTWQSTPAQVATITGVAALDSGGNSAVALTSAGQVWRDRLPAPTGC